jgi:hypothetical protein
MRKSIFAVYTNGKYTGFMTIVTAFKTIQISAIIPKG